MKNDSSLIRTIQYAMADILCMLRVLAIASYDALETLNTEPPRHVLFYFL